MTMLAEEIEKAENSILLNEVPQVLEVAYQFRAMNTDIEMIIYTHETEKAAAACHQIETIFNETEDLLSRFRSSSELSQLNQSGYLENVSDLLFENVAAAYKMAAITEGIFDPTILDALEAAGYNRSYEKITASGAQPQLLIINKVVTFQPWRFIKLDATKRSIKLPFGTRIDLGGIAKGSTVDRVAKFLYAQGFVNFMISAGGDMWLAGVPPIGDNAWTVAVQNPIQKGATEIKRLLVTNKAVATSATTGRRWQVNNQNRHHLIDPRTGEPTNNHIASVTAVADSVQLADVMAKTALIMGPQGAKKLLAQISGLSALYFVTDQQELIEL